MADDRNRPHPSHSSIDCDFLKADIPLISSLARWGRELTVVQVRPSMRHPRLRLFVGDGLAPMNLLLNSAGCDTKGGAGEDFR